MRFILLNQIQYRVEPTGIPGNLAYKLYRPGRKTPFEGLRSTTQPGVVIVLAPGRVLGFFDDATGRQLSQGPTKYEAALPPTGGPTMNGALAFNIFDHADKAGLTAVLMKLMTDPETTAICNVKDVVLARATEPHAGFIADSLSYELCCGIVLTVEDRNKRRTGTAVVRVNGVTVLHQMRNTYISGEWERVLQRATDELGLGDVPSILADVTGDREAIAA